MKYFGYPIVFILLFGNNIMAQAEIPGLELSLGNASVSTQQNELIVSTGTVEGRWTWTGAGFVTTGFKELKANKEWVTEKPVYLADWDLSLFENSNANLISFEADVSTDDNFTSKHIRISAEVEYPASDLAVRFEIWAYPNAPGLRTQLFVKGIQSFFASGIACSNEYRIDYLPVSLKGLNRQAVGFYNDHDGRNADTLDFVDNEINQKVITDEEKYSKANILFLYNETGGLGLVKESHKVVNKEGINTGLFNCFNSGIESTGWGLALANMNRDEYKPCWASWRICWDGGEDEKQLAIKMFDRLRYPLSEKDLFLMTNIWGAGQGTKGAGEENVLKEIKSCADLGIDVVQIDAGWQDREMREKTSKESSEVYPDGWTKIMKAAADNNIKMGIWNTAASVNRVPDKLIDLNDVGFNYFKIDIGTWSTYDMLYDLTENVRNLLKHSDYNSVVNWDVTHKGLRVGYLFNREYGNLFLQNRRLQMEGRKISDSHTYVPRRILKDEWLFAPYLNLNQMLFNVQTTNLVLPEYSNASLYGDVYSFAIAMMSSPLFFTETWRYSPESRKDMKEIIGIYKEHRKSLYKGYVFSLGERPNDYSWTGFQNFHPNENMGYLTLFREINNEEEQKSIKLHFISDKILHLKNLITKEEIQVNVDKNGNAIFNMEKSASFRFYKYSIFSSEGRTK